MLYGRFSAAGTGTTVGNRTYLPWVCPGLTDLVPSKCHYLIYPRRTLHRRILRRHLCMHAKRLRNGKRMVGVSTHTALLILGLDPKSTITCCLKKANERPSRL